MNAYSLTWSAIKSIYYNNISSSALMVGDDDGKNQKRNHLEKRKKSEADFRKQNFIICSFGVRRVHRE